MMFKTVLFTALLGMGSTVAANELIFTLEKSGGSGSSALAFDLVSDGSVAGFNFTVDLGSTLEKSVGTTSCIADLPKGFTGGCQIAMGKLNVIAYAETPGLLLPSGVVSVGHVLIKGLDSEAPLTVSNLALSDDNGNSIAIQSKFAGSMDSSLQDNK